MKRFFARLDARVVIFVGAAIVLLAAYWAVVALSEEFYLVEAPSGSTFSSDDTGTKVLYNYLQELGVETQALQNYEVMPESGTIAVIAQAPLEVEPTRALGERLADWVSDGGRLVMVGPEARDVLMRVPVGASINVDSKEATLTPLVPSFYSDGVESVGVGPERALAEDGAWVTHLKDTGGQVMVSRSYGEGELLWLSSIDPVSNARIDDADNARLATLVLAARQPVYFDEFHHGFVAGGGLWDRLGSGGQAGLLLSFAGLAVLLAAVSRRLGAAIEPVPERPARSGAYIASLAELYRKSGARGETLNVLEEGLREATVRRYGSLELGMKRHRSLRGALERASAARAAASLSETDFVSIARDISRARREVEGRDV